MFKSAALKLSLYYLAIIMILSLGFSFFLYHISDEEINRSLRRPEFVTYDAEPAPDYDLFRQERLYQAQQRLRTDLMVFNVFILVIGGVVSYGLARRTLEPIEQAMEAQSRFTADASHELRTPLTAMQTEIEVALRNKQLSRERAVKLLGSNLEEVIKLRTLAEALLKLSQQGQQALNLVPLTLDEVVAEAVSRLDHAARTKKIEIVNQLQPLTVKADDTALSESIFILLDNAIKYSPAKSTITISSHKHGHEARLSIQDQGIGIEPQDLAHIFDRFYRSESSRTKNQTEGYGLGLSIAHALTKLQKGRIEASSQPGHGSTFVIHLPLANS